MLVKVQQKIMTVITMTAPTVLLRVHQEAVPINLQELQVEAPVAVNQTAEQAVAPATVVQAVAPVAEVNLAAAAPAAENLPAVKVQNNA